MKICILDDKAVRSAAVCDYSKAIADVEEAYKAYSSGSTSSSKIALDIDTALDWKFNSLVCIGDKYAINKWLGANAENLGKKLPRSSGMIVLNDRETGLPLCIMNGTLISAVRTGASAAVAVKHLSKKGSKVAAIIGTGPIGKECAMALSVLGFEKFKITSLDPSLKEIAEDWNSETGIQTIAAGSVQDACIDADVVISATTAPKPIIKDEWLEQGVLRVNLGGVEDEDDVILNSSKLINDSWKSTEHRDVQSIAKVFHKGKITEKDIYPDIGRILLGEAAGRENDAEKIFFNAVGLGELDLFIAQRVYENANKDHFIDL
jgi:ornithine cyclodeaminase